MDLFDVFTLVITFHSAGSSGRPLKNRDGEKDLAWMSCSIIADNGNKMRRIVGPVIDRGPVFTYGIQTALTTKQLRYSKISLMQ